MTAAEWAMYALSALVWVVALVLAVDLFRTSHRIRRDLEEQVKADADKYL